MRCMRIAESSVLGYRIERLEEYDETGLLLPTRYEVICPVTGAVLASHPSLRSARRHVILHELRAARRHERDDRTMLIA